MYGSILFLGEFVLPVVVVYVVVNVVVVEFYHGFIIFYLL